MDRLRIASAVVISTLSMVSTAVLADLTSAMMALLWFKLILIILPPYVFAGMAISCIRLLSRKATDALYIAMETVLADWPSIAWAGIPGRRVYVRQR